MRMKLFVLLAAAVLLIPSLSAAQIGQSATLTGTVADQSGAVLPGVTVNVTGESVIGGSREPPLRTKTGLSLPRPAAGHLHGLGGIVGVQAVLAGERPPTARSDDHDRSQVGGRGLSGSNNRGRRVAGRGRQDLLGAEESDRRDRWRTSRLRAASVLPPCWPLPEFRRRPTARTAAVAVLELLHG